MAAHGHDLWPYYPEINRDLPLGTSLNPCKFEADYWSQTSDIARKPHFSR